MLKLQLSLAKIHRIDAINCFSIYVDVC